MSLTDLLDERATLIDPGETLDPTTRRAVDNPTTVASGVPCAYVKRSDATVVHDDQGGVVTDADLVLTAHHAGADTPAPAPGWQIVVEGRGTLLVTGDPQTSRRRITGETVSYRVPVRYHDV